LAGRAEAATEITLQHAEFAHRAKHLASLAHTELRPVVTESTSNR